MHGVRWSDGAINLDPPGPDAASGTHTYVALQTDMDEAQLRLFWDNRGTTAQRLETSRCFVDRVVVAGGNQMGGVQGLAIVTARQLGRSAGGDGVRGGAVQSGACSQSFGATVHLCWMAGDGPTTTQCFTIGQTVFR